MILLLVLVLLVLINSYFSAAEIALVAVKKFKIQQEADKGNHSAKQILELLKDPDEYLSSIQVGITLVGMIEGLYGGEVLAGYIEPQFLEWGMSSWAAHSLGLVLSIGLITYVTIVIGELLPKSIALQNPQKTALRIVSSFRIFTFLAFPFIKLLTSSTHFMFRILGVRNSENQKLTEHDLRSLLTLAYRQGTLDKNKYILHENLFNFYGWIIEKIMTPKEKVIMVDELSSHEMIETTLRQSVHNFFPVVKEKTIVVGYISAKDFFMESGKSLHDITKTACVIHGKRTASELLERFKEENQNFGIVVNDKGQLDGVVTMHDIGELLIGKIP